MELMPKNNKETYLHNKSIDNWYKKEKTQVNNRIEQFKLIKKYNNFNLYEHKKAGYRECFYN